MKIDWDCKDCLQGINVGQKKEEIWCDKCDEILEKKHREEVFNNGYICMNTKSCKICTEYIAKNKKKSKKKFEALWFSVSPPRVDPYKMSDGMIFVKRMEKFFQSNGIERAIWTFEWKYKGTPLSEHGIHCHCLIFGIQKKINWHIQRQKEKYFNLNKEQRFVIYNDDQELVLDKIKYFIGDTFDEKKNLEKMWDRGTRQRHNIRNTYFKKCDLESFGISSSNKPKEAKIVVEF